MAMVSVRIIPSRPTFAEGTLRRGNRLEGQRAIALSALVESKSLGACHAAWYGMTIKDQIPTGLLLRIHQITHDPMRHMNETDHGSSPFSDSCDLRCHGDHNEHDHPIRFVEDTVEIGQDVDERNQLVAEIEDLAGEKRDLLNEVADAESRLRMLKNEEAQVNASLDDAEVQRPVSYAIPQTMLPVHDKDDAPPPPRQEVHEVFEYMYGSRTGSLMDLLA